MLFRSIFSIFNRPSNSPKTTNNNVSDNETPSTEKIGPDSYYIPLEPSVSTCSNDTQEDFCPKSHVSSVQPSAEETQSVSLEEVAELIRKLSQDFNTKLMYDAKKNEIVDQLNTENQEYKNDLVWSIKKSLIEGIIAEIDDVEKRWTLTLLNTELPEDVEELKKRYHKVLKYVCKELPENMRYALEAQDVYAFSSEGGSLFDPKTQRVMKTSTTDNPQLDKTIKSIRPGYRTTIRDKETLVRPELVEVFKYEERTREPISPSKENAADTEA